MTFVPETAWALQERDAKGSDSSTKDGHLLVMPALPSTSSRGRGSPLLPGHNRDGLIVHSLHSLRSEGADASEDGTGRGTPLVFTERTRSGEQSLEIGGEVAFALGNPGEGGRSDERMLLAQSAVRRLTPLECERLMGFPDGWTAVDGMSDSARYRMCGNAVVTNVAQWLGERLMAALG